MTPTREILWNIPGPLMGAVYVASTLALLWAVAWFVRRSRLWRRGESVVLALPVGAGLRRLAGYLLTHRTIRRDPYAGVMHALIFWGFVALFIATTLVGIQHHGGIEFLVGPVYLVFSLFADLGGVAFCVGIGMALWRRRSPAATGRLLPSLTTTWMLWGLLILGVSGFVVEAARIARDFPAFEVWSPAGYTLALVLGKVGASGEAALSVHRAAWSAHALLAVVFFVIVPLTLLKHIVVAAWSVARPAGTAGVLSPPRAMVTTAVDLEHFRDIDLLQADACLTCGLCTEVCPAEAAGKPLSPRSVVLGVRAHLDRPGVSLTSQIADDALWSCTTCNACDVACPANINIVEKIVTLRRGRVAEGLLPESAAESLESAAHKFNPFGRANSARMEWASGLSVPVAQADEPIELLYWVGCGGAFDPAGREVARAMVRILDSLKISYRVLGCRERCTGDPARRLGEEGLWQELAQHNRQTLTGHSVRTVLTHCPHCFNAFRNEYAALGPMPEVVHHSVWLRDRIADGTLRVKARSNERITFHDPCYLARANGEIDAPRAILDAMGGDSTVSPADDPRAGQGGGRVEMAQHGTKALCCGGGGGQLWLDVRGRTRVETLRAEHVESTAAGTVATACPFCRVMLEAGRTTLPEGAGKWRVKDVAELVVENLDSPA